MKNVVLTRQRFARLTLIVIVVISMGFVEALGVLRPLRQLLQRGWQPLQKVSVGVAARLAVPLRLVNQLSHAAERIQDLERENAEAAVQVSELQSLHQQLAALSATCQATLSAQPNLRELVPIVAYGQPTIRWVSPTSDISASVIVRGVLVGRTTQSDQEYTQVALLRDRQIPPVLAQTAEDQITGLIRGDGQRIWLMEVPIQDTLHEGDQVVSTGQPGVPPHIPIGQIKAIVRQEGETTQMAEIEQPASFFTESWVEVRP